jgi:regulatory protein
MLRDMDDEPPPPTRRRGPRRATRDALEAAACDYVRRYDSSAETLRRVLMRRVERSARHHGTDREQGAAMAEAIVRRLVAHGLVDDRRYAEVRARSLNARGASVRAIEGRLAAKGVAPEVIETALAMLGTGDADRSAAARYARRRRLGPFRPHLARMEWRERDLAALARAGFDDEVALAVIDAEDPAELV